MKDENKDLDSNLNITRTFVVSLGNSFFFFFIFHSAFIIRGRSFVDKIFFDLLVHWTLDFHCLSLCLCSCSCLQRFQCPVRLLSKGFQATSWFPWKRCHSTYLHPRGWSWCQKGCCQMILKSLNWWICSVSRSQNRHLWEFLIPVLLFISLSMLISWSLYLPYWDPQLCLAVSQSLSGLPPSHTHTHTALIFSLIITVLMMIF